MTGIDDKIDQWHESDSDLPLHEFLGMTWERYKSWVASPNQEDSWPFGDNGWAWEK